ncbi:MAG TPA: cytochrome c peroxidase [Candidatus Competibacteraceae bacterium]|nr:cytochrome c peroxidase [Candidatus Competibacteraceae bacterium]
MHAVRARLTALLLLFPSLAAAQGVPDLVVSDADFPPRNLPREALGRLLFFDKILSGDRNIACATCHNPQAALGDGLSLPLGTGAVGFGTGRRPDGPERGVTMRIPRNAPALFNLGAREFSVLFADGRVAADPAQPGRFLTPAGERLPPGLDGVLAAQALFTLVTHEEMAGQPGANPVADAVAADRLEDAWELLAQRLRAIPEYVELFRAAFPELAGPQDMHIVHAANALAAFQAAALRCTDSPFDRAVRGDRALASPAAEAGAELFYGKAGCSHCHSGPFQTDHRFHAIGVPQIGPGKGDNQPGYFDGLDDFGRERETFDPIDRFRFRTPSLRQIALTGPWGHAGAYADLKSMVRHHLNPAAALERYDPAQARLPPRADLDAQDFTVMRDPERRRGLAARLDIVPLELSEEELDRLVAFLHALTDPACIDLRGLQPMTVPSGLAVGD